MKTNSNLFLLPFICCGAVNVGSASAVLAARDDSSIMNAYPTAQPIGANNASSGNFTDGVDPNQSFLDDVPAVDGGYENTTNTSSNDTFLNSRSQKRAYRPGVHGAESVLFSNDTNDVNITWAKCAMVWGQPVGRWTFFNHSTHDFVTWWDIYKDVCAHAGIPLNHGKQIPNPQYGKAMNAALSINAGALQNESTDLLISALSALAQTDDSQTTDEFRDELRKLLTINNKIYWSFVLVGTIVLGGTNTGLYYSAHKNDTAWQIAESGVATSFIFLASATIGWLATHPRVQNLDRHLTAGALTAARQTANIARQSANTVGGLVRSTSSTLLSTQGSQHNLLQMGGSAGRSPPNEPAGGGDFLQDLSVPGTSLEGVRLAGVTIDEGIRALGQTEIQPAGFSPLRGVLDSIESASASGSGSCP